MDRKPAVMTLVAWSAVALLGIACGPGPTVDGTGASSSPTASPSLIPSPSPSASGSPPVSALTGPVAVTPASPGEVLYVLRLSGAVSPSDAYNVKATSVPPVSPTSFELCGGRLPACSVGRDYKADFRGMDHIASIHFEFVRFRNVNSASPMTEVIASGDLLKPSMGAVITVAYEAS